MKSFGDGHQFEGWIQGNFRQLRQLKYDGESSDVTDDGKTVVIEGEAIALGEDAGAEIKGRP